MTRNPQRHSGRRRLLAGIASGASLIVFGPGPAAAETEAGAEPAGAVETLTGPAWAEGEAARDLAPAAPVFVGDRVVTGAEGRLGLLLTSEARVFMGPRTRLTIDRFIAGSATDLVLGEGAIIFDRDGDAAPTPVALSTAFGTIAVRGTRFFAGPSRGTFGVFVVRGALVVTAAGVEIALAAGFGTDIAAPGAPPLPPREWGAARIAEALAQVLGPG